MLGTARPRSWKGRRGGASVRGEGEGVVDARVDFQAGGVVGESLAGGGRVCVSVYACVHACRCLCMRVCMRARVSVYACVHACMCRLHERGGKRVGGSVSVCIYTCIHAQRERDTYKHAERCPLRMYTHKCTHADMHGHTCTYTHKHPTRTCLSCVQAKIRSRNSDRVWLAVCAAVVKSVMRAGLMIPKTM